MLIKETPIPGIEPGGPKDSDILIAGGAEPRFCFRVGCNTIMRYGPKTKRGLLFLNFTNIHQLFIIQFIIKEMEKIQISGTRKFALTVIGVIMILLSFIAYYNGVRFFGISGILWFSYTTLFLVGLGILTRSSYLIGSQLNIIIIPYIVWNIDFFYVLLTGNSLWGITDYFFLPRESLAQLISLQHIFIIPIAFLALYFIKFKRKDFWKLSVIQITVFYFLIRILAAEERNVNCSFQNCLKNLPIDPSIYPFVWFLGYIVMIVLTNLLLTRIKIFQHNQRPIIL